MSKEPGAFIKVFETKYRISCNRNIQRQSSEEMSQEIMMICLSFYFVMSAFCLSKLDVIEMRDLKGQIKSENVSHVVTFDFN